MADNEGLTGVRQITELEKLLGRSENYWQLSAQEQWDEDKANGILDWDGSKEQAIDIINNNARKMFKNNPEALAVIDKQEYNRKNFKDVFEYITHLMELKYPNKEQQQGAWKALTMIQNFIYNREIPKS